MSLADELTKLDELRARGVLSDSEFASAKQRLLSASAAPTPTLPLMAAINGFRRSPTDRWLGGVCGGLARATGLESWAWRLIFALLFFAGGSGLILYLLLAIFVPSE